MRIPTLCLLLLGGYIANTVKSEVVAEGTVLETVSARVKLPSDTKWSDGGSLYLLTPYAFADGKVYHIPVVQAVQKSIDDSGDLGDLEIVMIEFLVPQDLTPQRTADHLANLLTYSAIFFEAMIPLGDRTYQYRIRSLPSIAPNAAQYQIVELLAQQERIVGWVALYWQSDRVVALVSAKHGTKPTDLRRWEKLWNSILSSFEWTGNRSVNQPEPQHPR
ncbi:MAG: hypothetical protein KatS3mg023_4058 [Armatimonadota bacterium]|nr:MAG: hypothetical protein KatS3mg023_4055 [Armatimonadota bacterium]GIV22307.1 MAG: hypothetical protein KatS3mg023_4058 [Armatimonadota bacterium]